MTKKQNDDNDFNAVDFFREVKERLAREFEGKTFEEQQALIDQFLSGKRKLDTDSDKDGKKRAA